MMNWNWPRARGTTTTAVALVVVGLIFSGGAGWSEGDGETSAAAFEGRPGFNLEEGVVQALSAMEEGHSRQALDTVDRVLTLEPNFRLAQLLKAELTRSETLLRNVAPDEAALQALRDEQQARLRGYQYRPPTGALPAAILQLPEGAPAFAVVDLDRSRLYLVDWVDGGLSVIADFYVAAGKNGPGKQVEGDGRTPIGIYRVGARLADSQLPPLYGAGALTLNYPNRWDRYLRRTGSGIWIHGTDEALYSRSPRSSDGCVTMANDDYEALGRLLPSKSRIVIEDGLEWVDREQLARLADEMALRIEQWRLDWESGDTDRYLRHYSRDFKAEGRDFSAWTRHKRRVNAQKSFIRVGLGSVSVYRYPGEQDLVLVEFRQDYRSSNFDAVRHKQQYWRHEGGDRWRIVYEGGY